MSSEPILCYVDLPWCYFTTQSLNRQWGDDWNDGPWEHNSGPPYTPCWHNEPQYVAARGRLCDCKACEGEWLPDGSPAWTITRVAIDAHMLVTPDDGHLNSPYSVEDINAGAVPWLRTNKWHEGDPVVIMAGTPFAAFCELVKRAGGTVYLPFEIPEGYRLVLAGA